MVVVAVVVAFMVVVGVVVELVLDPAAEVEDPCAVGAVVKFAGRCAVGIATCIRGGRAGSLVVDA